MQKQHSLGFPDCLDEGSAVALVAWEKKVSAGLGRKKENSPEGVCLKDKQFVFDKFFSFFLSLLKPSLGPLDYLKDDL